MLDGDALSFAQATQSRHWWNYPGDLILVWSATYSWKKTCCSFYAGCLMSAPKTWISTEFFIEVLKRILVDYLIHKSGSLVFLWTVEHLIVCVSKKYSYVVMWEFCKNNSARQRISVKLDPSPCQNPLVDLHQDFTRDDVTDEACPCSPVAKSLGRHVQ